MSDYEHIVDLRERRKAYADLRRAIEAGKLISGDPKGDEVRMRDLALKIADLDLAISSAETRRTQGS